MQLTRLAKRAVKIAIQRDLLLSPQVKCTTEYHGNETGGFTLSTSRLEPSSVIYSVGVGDNISFDLSLIQRFGVQVFAFDPTPRSLQWISTQQLPPQFKFLPFGLAAKDGEMKFFPPANESHVSFSMAHSSKGAPITCQVKTLKTLAQTLGHSRIDVLKIDIEGSEYEVIPSILESGLKIGQILAEFHHRMVPRGARLTRLALRQLNEHGYKLFSVSERGEELSFIHETELDR